MQGILSQDLFLSLEPHNFAFVLTRVLQLVRQTRYNAHRTFIVKSARILYVELMPSSRVLEYRQVKR